MGSNEDAVRRDLRALTSKNRLVGLSGLEQLAVTLARQIDAADEPRDIATLTHQLRMTLADLRRTTPSTTRSGIDELRARRETRKRAAGGAAP